MPKILIIEDEKILAEMYQDKFSEAGFEVSLAFDSKEGLEMAEKEKPDLILLDILLPEENGITFLKRLRQNPEISSLQVVALSNYDEPKTKREAARLGAKDYLIKTEFTPTQLVEKIKEYLPKE